jgi:hypothetical protein
LPISHFNKEIKISKILKTALSAAPSSQGDLPSDEPREAITIPAPGENTHAGLIYSHELSWDYYTRLTIFTNGYDIIKKANG